MKNILVIGGGIAGVTAAFEISKNDRYDITLMERSDVLGGLNSTENFDGNLHDIGTFIYNSKHPLMTTFPFLKEALVTVKHEPIVLLDKDKTDVHPISLKGYLRNHGVTNFIKSISYLILDKFRYRNYTTLPEYCKYYLGSLIYNKSGLKGYINRLYRMNDDEIDIKFGQSRMANLSKYSLRKLVLSPGKIFNKYSFTGKESQNESHYARPRQGYDQVYSALESELSKRKVKVLKGINITSIHKVERKFIVETKDSSHSYDRIVSSIPVAAIQRLIGVKPTYKFKYMGLTTLHFTGKVIPDNNAIYNYTKDGYWKRMTVFSKYYGKANGQDYFSVEVTIDKENSIHVDDLIHDFISFCDKYNIATDLKNTGHTLVPFAYPVFEKGETTLIERELQVVKDFGIDLIGRQGTFEYLSSGETILSTKNYVNSEFTT
ncbi:FAD-dependent oxidoreductase [Neolewinella antarctica]|uniref:Protoporphyrinogen oxidase n=1 Tax=Neolewinella antarctica TaxID=442734 RepID=A0ABX0XFJ8_9BACT|nr:FAD-dependent oxidoreductase [Neolewinella antarctica]NJC28002.1 protoporphyrinogen oxidase [Neolewinella antarctica]